ncbi:hypothetical protein D9619_012148 [Psilocybe cf. subviscida]|uniref:Uncharacterized protein n=1 Tax=Psilocybe cf. subviscida TaxID=2480587 RepID=A0A8H5EZX0_9AGAR|nr:hypothetical protein D9619_012148 [Psilocybe cf. subviscida]
MVVREERVLDAAPRFGMGCPAELPEVGDRPGTVNQRGRWVWEKHLIEFGLAPEYDNASSLKRAWLLRPSLYNFLPCSISPTENPASSLSFYVPPLSAQSMSLAFGSSQGLYVEPTAKRSIVQSPPTNFDKNGHGPQSMTDNARAAAAAYWNPE